LQDEQLTLAGDDEQTRQVALEELLILNPAPWEAGIGYNWSGRAAVAFSLQRGNTDTDELDYNINSVWRSDDDRYTINAVADVDEANGVKSADSWRINGKYDNFFDGDLYWGVNAYMESDEFADLELRYFLGPYVGREFYTAPLFSLSAEMGASYVNENFIVAEDQDYPAANWALDISSNYLGGDSRLYFNQLGIWNLDQTDNVIINTTLGLSIPLLWRVTAAAEIVLDYDSGAVEGVEELDQTYRFNIGYTW
jgi:putative salt-induced outer membrane protein YdiY